MRKMSSDSKSKDVLGMALTGKLTGLLEKQRKEIYGTSSLQQNRPLTSSGLRNSSNQTSSSSASTASNNQQPSIRLSANDRDDLRFDLRKHKRRVEEIYEGRQFHELSSDELNLARKVIIRESKQPLAPTFRPVPTSATNNAVANGLPTKQPSITSSSTVPVSNNKTGGNSILSKLYANDQQIPNSEIAARIVANKPIVPSGSVPSTFSLTQPRPAQAISSRLHETKHIRLVGSSLVDQQQLALNAQKDLQNLQQRKEQLDTKGQQVKQQAKQALLAEVDELLTRKSTHDAEASEEWHQQYQDKLKKLEKREFIQQKFDSVTFIEVQAFQCRQCEHHVYPSYPTTCRDMGHAVLEITAIKRFFECMHCGGRDSTLTNKSTDHTHIPAPPSWRCRCGEYRWVVKGSGKRTEQTTSLSGDRLVTSASESSSRRDSLEMAVRVSQLSQIR